MSERKQLLRARAAGEGSELLAPSVGIFTPSVARGELVSAGQSIGTLDILGVQRALLVPEGVAGRVTQRLGGARTRVPVQYGDVLLAVSTSALSGAPAESGAGAMETAGALSFVAPMSGRFYSRPSPNDPPFVSAGDTVTHGQTVGLLEVMKTFNRLVYEGDGLPTSAIVERIVPTDGDDVVRADPILLLASVEG